MNQTFVLSRIQAVSASWSRITQEALTVAVFNLFLIFTAQVSIPLPLSPVPITGQTLGVLLAAMALGRGRATAVIGLYLLEGVAGLPVFAGGAAGAHHLLGPTGGYLVGFLAAGALCGWLAERGWDRKFGLSLAAMIVGQTVIFACGLAQLSFFLPSQELLVLGFYPFIPGAIVKTAAAFALFPSVARLTRP